MLVDRKVRVAFCVGCAAMMIGGLGFRMAVARLQVFLKKEPVPLREPLDSVSATLGQWKQVGKDATFSDALIEELGTRSYLDRVYAVDGDLEKGFLQVHAAYYTGMIDAVPHIPERCWNANGLVMRGQPVVRPISLDRSAWDLTTGPVQPGTGLRYPTTSVRDAVTRTSVTVNLPLGEVEMTVSAFQDARSPSLTNFGGYLFIANGAMTPSALAVRNLSFKLADRYAYYCKIQFSARLAGDEEKAMAEFERMTSELMPHLLSQLMRCLPDWPAIEMNQTTPSTLPTP